MSTPLDKLKELLTTNKTPLAVGGAALVALIAWRRKVKGAGSPAAAAAAPGVGYSVPGVRSSPYSSATPTSSSGYTAPNDSTGSDVYNAIQPQLEALQQLINAPKPPIPVPAAPPAAPPSVQAYMRRAGSAAVYAAQSDGTLKFMDLAAYNDAGKPTFTDAPASDPLWARAVTGTDAPGWAKTGINP